MPTPFLPNVYAVQNGIGYTAGLLRELCLSVLAREQCMSDTGIDMAKGRAKKERELVTKTPNIFKEDLILTPNCG